MKLHKLQNNRNITEVKNHKCFLLTVLILIAPGYTVLAQTLERQAVIEKARQLKTLYKTDAAIELLSTLVTDDDGDGEAAFDEEVMAELADCHFQNGDLENAAGLYFILSQTVPDKIVYRIRQMVCFYRLKAYAQAAQIGQLVMQQDTIPSIMTMVGDSFNQMEKYDSALVWYGNVLKIKPKDASVVNKVAKIYLGRKDYDSALAVTDSLLVLDPDNTTIAPVKGVALYLKEDYDAAVDVFERQKEIGNDSYGVHFYLGQSYWQKEVLYRAEEELKKAWAIDSTDVNLAFSIAGVLHDSYRSFDNEVKPWLDKAIEMLEPDHVTLARIHQQYGLGYYRSQNNWPKAIEHYKIAHENNPKLISAMSTIAYCYEQMKDYRSALEWYQKYLKVATPGSRGYNFAEQSVSFIKGELFMEEK